MNFKGNTVKETRTVNIVMTGANDIEFGQLTMFFSQIINQLKVLMEMAKGLNLAAQEKKHDEETVKQ